MAKGARPCAAFYVRLIERGLGHVAAVIARGRGRHLERRAAEPSGQLDAQYFVGATPLAVLRARTYDRGWLNGIQSPASTKVGRAGHVGRPPHALGAIIHSWLELPPLRNALVGTAPQPSRPSRAFPFEVAR